MSDNRSVLWTRFSAVKAVTMRYIQLKRRNETYFFATGGAWLADPLKAYGYHTRDKARAAKRLLGLAGLKGYTIVSGDNPLFKLEHNIK